jgi:galactose mutarotase-like enzyme
MSGLMITISSAELTATISPSGAELQSLLDRQGRELMWDGNPAVWTGRAPVLFPIIGSLRDEVYLLDGKRFAMRKHGFARHSNFKVVAQEQSRVVLRLSASDETRAIYPFEFQLDIMFALSAEDLKISASVTNLGDTPMPASLGFHPAFRWPLPYGEPRAEHRLNFPKPEPAPIRRIDASGLLKPQSEETPVDGDTLRLRDELFTDDALIFDQLASRSVTYGANRGPRLKIDFADFPTLGVWTKPGAGFVCIEPWHGHSDPEGFAGDIQSKPGIFEVSPGSTRVLEMTVTWLPGEQLP